MANPNTGKLLAGTAIVNGITAADFVKQTAVNKPLWNFSIPLVQGLIAQAAKTLALTTATFSNAKGVGQFGFSPAQLESTGYIKPGTTTRFIVGNTNTVSVLESPAIWTGKNNVINVTVILDDARLQNLIQYELMELTLAQILTSNLLIEKVPFNNFTDQEQGGILLSSTKYGTANVVKWIQNKLESAETVNLIKTLARAGEYAVFVVDNKFPNNVKGQETPINFSGNIARKTLDNTVKQIIGNEKVPKLNF